ncbi:MAG TPA: efflux RND transporter periplasmic adaptor subunit [Steroidobacteraceae bacterium]
MPTVAAHAVDVDIAEVISRPVKEWRVYTGQLEAVEQVEVRPQVSGMVTGIHFEDGQLVERGSLLFTIDPSPYKTALERAAALRAVATARTDYCRLQLARAQRLLDVNAISKEEADARQNDLSEAVANLAAADATLAAAQLDLEHTHIVAPIRGRASRALITVGNIVNANSIPASTLTTLVSVSPIYAWFGMDEGTYLRMTERGFHDSQVLLGLAPDSEPSRSGRIHDVDNKLDPVSGTVRVRAVFDNVDGELRPGLLARIRMSISTNHPGVLISDAAIGLDQDKRYVLIVDHDNQTLYREVTIGDEQEGLRVITAGLREGDRIVVNGTQRAKAGDQVSPTLVAMPHLDPTGTPHPAPTDPVQP